jgi:MOSC domain-containing protein YiiM
MRRGVVDSIHIAWQARGPLRSVPEVHAVPGQGLEGDRYFRQAGSFSKKASPDPDRQITLIEREAIEALERDYGARLNPGEARRNIVTRGVALNHLVGREFRVGEVALRGIRLCEPCGHLASLSHEKVVPGLIHRGGLRAQILTEGIIRVGDVLEYIPALTR